MTRDLDVTVCPRGCEDRLRVACSHFGPSMELGSVDSSSERPAHLALVSLEVDPERSLVCGRWLWGY